MSSAVFQKQINDIRRGSEYRRLRATGSNYQKLGYLENKIKSLEKQRDNAKRSEENARGKVIIIRESPTPSPAPSPAPSPPGSPRPEKSKIARRPKGPANRAAPSRKKSKVYQEPSDESDEESSESSGSSESSESSESGDEQVVDSEEELDKITKYKLKEMRENVKLLEEGLSTKHKARRKLNKAERQLKEKDVKIKEKKSQKKQNERNRARKNSDASSKRQAEIIKQKEKNERRAANKKHVRKN